MTKKLFLIILLLILISSFCSAEYFYDQKNNFAIDFVDSFYLQSQSENGYLFVSDIIPVEFAVNLYEKSRFTDTKAVLEFMASSLGSQDAEFDSLEYRGQTSTLSIMSFVFQETPCFGWAVSLYLKDIDKYLCVLGYTASENEAICEEVILSVLDSIYIDNASYFLPGLVTSYSHPAEGISRRSISFEGIKADITFDKSDAKAAEYLIKREYLIFQMMRNTDYWFSSWQRFYQLIYRDSYSRIKNACSDFCQKLYAKNFSLDDPDAAYAELVLKYVQQFPYGRQQNYSDITDLPSAFLGSKSDCDSRSLLCAVLLNMMNIKSTFFVSIEYRHALVGSVINKEGACIQVDQDKFLLGETTAKVPFGQVAQDMNDSDKWINIPLAWQ
ncbi:MAG: hypothetical protein K5839_05490 [Treponemataceae bacterium]|nr:hypothetical protein [Treponemataceae bacterium]